MSARILLIATAIAAALFAGCATQKQVTNLQGQGTTMLYNAPFEQVWRASVDGAQLNDLEILTADRESGLITARRTMRPHTFGENVALWVRPRGPMQTELEVVSRQAGPPVAWLRNWENEIHRAVSANLTREMPAQVAPPAAGAPPQDTWSEHDEGGHGTSIERD